MSGWVSSRTRRLDQRLVLETVEPVPDGAGGCVETWQALGTLWAEVSPRTGRQASGAAGAVARNGYFVWVRGAADDSTARPRIGQRFLWAGRRLSIEAVSDEPPRGMYLKCACTEEVAP
ncbi:phage head closure protein [Sagittula sp. SSi028]|uniref:phage head closure protein n=1 Tax=Sagittula sp. SSi028 TaxID=3400636 RepID=UPI003AF4E7D8